jgi:hypothetical protein
VAHDLVAAFLLVDAKDARQRIAMQSWIRTHPPSTGELPEQPGDAEAELAPDRRGVDPVSL